MIKRVKEIQHENNLIMIFWWPDFAKFSCISKLHSSEGNIRKIRELDSGSIPCISGCNETCYGINF